jgi:hypothetical protein
MKARKHPSAINRLRILLLMKIGHPYRASMHHNASAGAMRVCVNFRARALENAPPPAQRKQRVHRRIEIQGRSELGTVVL